RMGQMELRSEITQRLRRSRDFLGLIDSLEHEAEQVQGAGERSEWLYQLGEVCEEVFLRKDRAMLNYQKAFKVNPQNTRAIQRARAIYREMANVDMLAKLCEIELKLTQDGGRKAEIFGELGLALLELRQRDRAIDCLETAFAVRPHDVSVAEALAAAKAHRDAGRNAIARLQRDAERAPPAAAGPLWLRVARVQALEDASRAEYEQWLRRALAADPQSDEANFLLEQILAARKQWEDIVVLHEQRARVAPAVDRARLYRRFASVWAVRWDDASRWAAFYRKALEAYYSDGVDRFPGHIAAFDFLREISSQSGDWTRLIELAELGLSARIDDIEKALLAAGAGAVAWKQLKD